MTEVRIEQGVVRGDRRDGVFRFRGLPYAAAPVGRRRWAPPGPPAGWEGVRNATEFGNAAIQFADRSAGLGAEPDEDCLNLNIWSPALDSGARLPVMVWIHGGGFMRWSASMKEWHGRGLARRGAVVVSLNYRLGVLGFLSHPEAGGNCAVQDWVAALRWVAGNIGAFGGDSGNVTVFGQSAGAEAVRTLLSTPSARGLFHRGILQSAGFEPMATETGDRHERIVRNSAAFFDLVGGSDLDHLRALPIETVRRAAMAVSSDRLPDRVHTPGDLAWRPAADGRVVGADLSSWDPDVPVLFGSNEHEARWFFTPTGPMRSFGAAAVYTPALLENSAKTLGGEHAAEIVDRLTGSPYEALAELFTTAAWTEPRFASYRRFAQMPRTAFAYHFARVTPASRADGMLAHHCAELAYVFGGSRTAPEKYDETDGAISDALQCAWIAFARDGVPRDPDGNSWPAATTAAPHITLIDDTVRAVPLRPSPITALINSLRAHR